MCDPNSLDTKVRHARDTWAKHCDITLYMSSQTNSSFPTIGLVVLAGRQHIGAKAKAAWTHVYTHYIDQAEYFVKCDPDTFLVVPNLRVSCPQCSVFLIKRLKHALSEYLKAGVG